MSAEKLKILNKTRNLTLSSDARKVSSFFGRLRGLVLSEPSDIVLVSPREGVKSSSIHMLFMGYPIDVIWVNSEGIIVDVKREIKPSSILKPESLRIIKPKSPAKYVIELGKGSAGETRILDEIEFS